MYAFLRRSICLLSWIFPAVLLGGCAVAAWFATLFPPDKVKPLYEIPKNNTLLVLVEDPKHHAGETALKTELTEFLNQEFEQRGLVEHVVSYRQLINLAAATENFRALSTSEVGKKLDADVVLYVQVDEFSLKDDPNSPFWHGNLSTLVRLVSVKEGRLWPRELPEGYKPRKVDGGSVSGDGSRRFEQKLVRDMALEMADNIAKLFYEHRGQPHGALPQDETVERP